MSDFTSIPRHTKDLLSHEISAPPKNYGYVPEMALIPSFKNKPTPNQ